MAVSKIGVLLDIKTVHQRNEKQFRSELLKIFKDQGLQNCTILSSGIQIQGQAKDYWAIVAIVEVPKKKVST